MNAVLLAGLLLLFPTAQTAEPSVTEERALAGSLNQPIALAPPGSIAPISLDLIRAQVRIEPSPDGAAAMIVRAARPDQAAGIVLRLRRDSRGIEVTDLYPVRSRVSAMDECLPPPDVRGDFWLADAGIDVVLRVPAAVRVTVHLRDGMLRDLRAQ